uniref:SKI-interacting protein SKIP SNW domain-containing protein n=1 Tax=Meloidogyne javanica TaxID=6303 RepID=A0A915MDG2_MELJA
MKSKHIDDEDESFKKPTDDEIHETTETTRAALEKITTAKIAAALPVQHAKKTAPAQFIRYTPSQQSGLHASGAQQRIIRLVEEQKDPMEPPRFQINQKIPRAPPSPPAPVMHSPTRKVTAKEQADWKIPPCVSNWKNPKGYTVALDKRLAADGRGLQQVHINEGFAKFAEALSIAERKARESVETRAQMERLIAQNKKTEQEKRMREMAQSARIQRSQALRKAEADEDQKLMEEAKEREAIRRDRVEDHRKERNIARSRPDKLEKLKRDKDRDISEKIALGLPDSRARASGETQFDARLFNQTGGLDSGGIDDETYTAYDKPWRPQDNVQQHIYRPRKDVDSGIYGADLDKIINTSRFVPDKGFSGTGGEGSGAPRGSGPVQFEREEEDIFGLGELLQTSSSGNAASSSSKRKAQDEGIFMDSFVKWMVKKITDVSGIDEKKAPFKNTFECPLCRFNVPLNAKKTRNYALEAILDSLEVYDEGNCEMEVNDSIAALQYANKRLKAEKQEQQQTIGELNNQLEYARKTIIRMITLFSLIGITLVAGLLAKELWKFF